MVLLFSIHIAPEVAVEAHIPHIENIDEIVLEGGVPEAHQIPQGLVDRAEDVNGLRGGLKNNLPAVSATLFSLIRPRCLSLFL